MIRKRILSELKSRGISQRQMALDLGLTRQNLNQFLRGKRDYPLRDVAKIFTYLNIQI
jgi:transcriptional regulator with XRE-family HTH domain